MQTTAPEFWWAVGIGSVSLVALGAAYIFSIVFNQRRFISNQRRQLEAVQESERKYRSLFENSQVGIIRVSLDDFKILDCNSTCLRMFGRNSLEEVESLLHSSLPIEDRHSAINRLIAEETVGTFVRRIVIDPDNSLWVSFSFKAFSDKKVAEGILVDVTEGKNAEEQLLASHQQLRNLSAHLQSVREEERVKIAREIHDELGQVLTVAKMYLSVLLDGIMMGQHSSMKSVHESLESITEIVDDSITLVKGIAYQLRPMILDDLGLKEAIEWEGAEFQKRTGITCSVNSEEPQLGREESAAVFRILQEALTNVARHAKASAVDVRMTADNEKLTLRIEDNGKGVLVEDTQKPKSLGIVGMKERAIFLGGHLDVRKVNGGGTAVHLEVPLNGKENMT